MQLGHVAFSVRDLDAMLGFSVGKLGRRVSDRGVTRGRGAGPPIAFLSFDPTARPGRQRLRALRADDVVRSVVADERPLAS